MTTQEMLDLLQSRTRVTNRAKKLGELRSAYRWVVRRVFNSADGPDLLATIGEELPPLAAVTRTLDIGAAVTQGALIGIKKLWLKLPSDTSFVGMDPMDSNDPYFIDSDAATAADPRVAAGHPVLYMVINFSQARFAPALPVGAIIRVDYFREGPAPGVPDTSSETSSSELLEDAVTGQDLPAIFHDAMVNKATAQLFNMLSDEREASWERNASDSLNDAIYMGHRVQAPTVTQPFRARRRRYL